MIEVAVKEMKPDQIGMIEQVNRRETVEAKYVVERLPEGMGLALRRVEMNPPKFEGPWSRQALDERIAWWKGEVENGGLLLGAFDGQHLIGFAVLGPTLPDKSAELVALFVNADHRRTGVGSLLMSELENRARRRDVRALFLAPNRTASSVQFYLEGGYKLIALAEDSLVDPRRARLVFAKEL